MIVVMLICNEKGQVQDRKSRTNSACFDGYPDKFGEDDIGGSETAL